MNDILKFALGLANMSEAEVADIDAKLPGMARLCAAAKELEPILQQAEPHIEALMPLITLALPIIKKAYPDIVASIPTIEGLIQFASQKGI